MRRHPSGPPKHRRSRERGTGSNRRPRRRFSVAAAIVVVTAGVVAGTPETGAAQVPGNQMSGNQAPPAGSNHRGVGGAGSSDVPLRAPGR
jgi:hypothetical protein